MAEIIEAQAFVDEAKHRWHDACQLVLEETDLHPELCEGILKTYCNLAVQRGLSSWGYQKFGAGIKVPPPGAIDLMANQIIAYILAHPEEWTICDGTTAVKKAVADVPALGFQEAHPHGHVVIIWPSLELVPSAKWKSPGVPQCVQIGQEAPDGPVGVNWAFGTPCRFAYLSLKS